MTYFTSVYLNNSYNIQLHIHIIIKHIATLPIHPISHKSYHQIKSIFHYLFSYFRIPSTFEQKKSRIFHDFLFGWQDNDVMNMITRGGVVVVSDLNNVILRLDKWSTVLAVCVRVETFI